MARNGNGVYTLPAGNPVVTGSIISSTWANTTLNDISTAITQSLANDGQTIPIANLPMGGYNHTNVANATVRTQYASAGQVQDSAFTLLASVSGTNAITAAATLGMSAYVAGQRFSFIATGTNTGATTININALGVLSITKNGTNALVAGDIQFGTIYQIVYDGTQFQLLNPSSVASTVSSFSAGTTGLTPSTGATGAVTLAGTLAVANGGTGATTSTGSGSVVLATSPALTGTPTAPTASTNTNSTQIATTAFANPGASLTANGYQKLPSGLIMQWGVVTNQASNNSTVVTLPIAFPNAIFGAWCNNIASSSGSNNTRVTALSASQITVYNGESGSGNNYWHVIGY